MLTKVMKRRSLVRVSKRGAVNREQKWTEEIRPRAYHTAAEPKPGSGEVRDVISSEIPSQA
jgi:hypothetical protein